MALTPEEKKAKKIASKEKQLAKVAVLLVKFNLKSDAKQAARIVLMTALSVETDNTKRIKLQAKIDKSSEMIDKYSLAITRYNSKKIVLEEELRILKL